MNLDREVFFLDIGLENDDDSEGSIKINGDTEGYRHCSKSSLAYFFGTIAS